ncbi:hypothetical protein SAMN05518855_1020121 [Paenibacillus sp. CF384]|nr:hypothetical protein SAMN05518855_1020121 [Paenibacillus sp. CF384]
MALKQLWRRPIPDGFAPPIFQLLCDNYIDTRYIQEYYIDIRYIGCRYSYR